MSTALVYREDAECKEAVVISWAMTTSSKEAEVVKEGTLMDLQVLMAKGNWAALDSRVATMTGTTKTKVHPE